MEPLTTGIDARSLIRYEFFQAYGWSEGIGESVANMINETAHGVPVVAHAYGAPNNCSDPLDKGIGIAVAAFLLAQGPVRKRPLASLGPWHRSLALSFADHTSDFLLGTKEELASLESRPDPNESLWVV
jgi:hypothetical protein